MVAAPEGFLGIGELDVFQLQRVHVAEHLWGFDERVHHMKVPGVPDGGAGSFPENAVFNQEVLIVPEGIFAVEFAVDGFDAGAFLQG